MDKNLQKNFTYRLLGLLAISSLIIFFITLPTIKDIKKIGSSISLKQADLENKVAYSANDKKNKEDIKNAKELIKQTVNIFVLKDKELEYISQLESIANKNNITINVSSDFITQNINNNTKVLIFKIILNGSFLKILNFIKEMSLLPTYYNSDSITITDNSSTNNPDFVSVQLIGKVYLQEN